jgi:mono/diheme cytochrome c family protein
MLRRSLPLLALAIVLGCSQEEASDPQVALVKRGEQLYLGNCIACHARNPNETGPVGPPIAGSSLELLEAKVLRNEYPPGYTPKRDSKAMVPLVHLEPELPAIAAFLAGAAAPQE